MSAVSTPPLTPAIATPAAAGPSALAGAALIGCTTGLRSQMGMAMLLNGVPPAQLPALLRHRGVRPIAVSAALAELVADKLPSTPPRTQARGLVPRIGLGGLSAGLLARSAGAPSPAAAAVGAGAAVGAAFAGITVRRALSKRMPPLAAAMLEDLVATALGVVAVRLAPSAPADDGPAGASDGQPA